MRVEMVAGLLQGKKVEMPPTHGTFKQAQKAIEYRKSMAS